MLYALEKADGGVILMRTVGDTDPVAEVSKWVPEQQALLAIPINIREINDGLVPAQREFRGAWAFTASGPVGVDIAKARVIHSVRLAAAREAALAALERASVEATIAGRAADATRARTDRTNVEALDLTSLANNIQSAADVNALHAVWPTELADFR